MKCLFCGKPYEFSTIPMKVRFSGVMWFYESNPDICLIHSYLLPRDINTYFIFFRCKSRSIDTSTYVNKDEIKNLDSLSSLINTGMFLKNEDI